MATPPGPWSWVPPDWLGGADVMPAPEMQFPDDGFADVTPDALAAARAERDAETEIQFPPDNFASVPPDELAAARAARDAEAAPAPDEIEMPADNFALPEHSRPTETGFARYEFPGWDPFASESEQAAAFAANNERAPTATPAQSAAINAAIDAGRDPFTALAALELPAEPDALTGAGGVPIAPLVPGLGIPQATFEQAMAQLPTTTAGVPELPEEYLTNQEAGQAFARLTPEQQIEKQLDLEQRREDFARTARAKAAKADAEEAERDERDWRTSRDAARRDLAQIDADAKAEAAREIDINRGWANASTGTKIAGIFSALAGGLVAHKYGGRNSGLEMIDNLINRDIDAQKFNKQQRLNALAARGGSARDRLAMAGDDFREETRLRLTAYDRVLGQITADAQNFDPRGTQAIRYGQAYQDLAAKRAQIAQDAQKRAADQYKEQLDFASKELDLQKKQADLAKAQRAGMGGGGSGTAGRLAPDQWAAQYGEAGRPPSAMNAKEYKEWLANRGKVETIAKTKNEADKAVRDEQRATADAVRELGMGGSTRIARDESGQPVVDGKTGQPVLERGNLLNKDGTPWKARSKEVADELAKNYAAAEDVTAMIDEILDIRDRVGGESTTFNSDDAQRLGVLENQVLKRVKEGTHGMSSDADMAVLKAAVGAKDITSFRAKAAGLEKGRERVIASLNRDLRYRGNYTGDPIAFENPYRKAPATTSEETQRKTLLKAPAISIDEADRQAAAIVRKRLGDDFKNPKNAAAASAEMASLAADYKDISPDQKIAIRKLGDLAGGTGPKAEQAEKDLSDIATSGHTEKIRAAAQEALMSASRTKGGI